MKRGFTLLEVLVAVAILGLGLTAILSAQAGAFSSAAHARNIGIATGLLRCKMSEVEEHLYREGFQDTDETGAGPCCETNEDPPNVKCTWRVDRPQFPEAKFGDLNLSAGLNFGQSGGGPGALGALGMLAGASGGPSPLGSASSMSDIARTLADANAQAMAPGGTVPIPPGVPPGALPPGMPSPDSLLPSPAGAPPLSPSGAPLLSPSGSPLGSPSGMPGDTMGPGADSGLGGLAGVAMSFVYPSLKILFEASTRRITASLTFREGKKEYTIDVVEWFAVPQLGLTPSDDSLTDSAPATGPAGASTAAGSAAGHSGAPQGGHIPSVPLMPGGVKR
jgi:general secretion pathway protein I